MSYDDIATLRDDRVRRHARSLQPAPPVRRGVPRVLQVDICDMARRPVRGETAAQTLPRISGGAVLVEDVPGVSHRQARPCAIRPIVLMLQAGGSIGLQADEHGYLILTVVDVDGNAVSVLANAEETAGIAGEIGGAA